MATNKKIVKSMDEFTPKTVLLFYKTTGQANTRSIYKTILTVFKSNTLPNRRGYNKP